MNVVSQSIKTFLFQSSCFHSFRSHYIRKKEIDVRSTWWKGLSVVNKVVTARRVSKLYLKQTYCKREAEGSDGKAEEAGGNVVISEHVENRKASGNSVKSEQGPLKDDTKQDIPRFVALLFLLTSVAFLVQHSWLAAHEGLSLTILFFIAYCGIVLEEILLLNKTAVALLAAVLLWSSYSTTKQGDELDSVLQSLSLQLSSISEIIFFLMGAMTIVEVIDAHRGFQLVTEWIKTSKKSVLLWISASITFLLSSVLDNLTSTIVMVSLLRKANLSDEERRLFGAAVVVAANAGGAWTPIGDVTTTMLWIQGHISTFGVMSGLFVPSLVTLLVSMAIYSRQVKDDERLYFDKAENASSRSSFSSAVFVDGKRGKLVLGTGVASLLFVPIFKALTGLPPYLGMLAGLGTIWLLTDVLHVGQESTEDASREYLKTSSALNRIDVASILFFLGILLCVGCLDSAGILKVWAAYISDHVSSLQLVAFIIGLASSVIDNVPIVAACMGMYDSVAYPKDSTLWQLVAYCAGTGGSIFIIGSAAGVALMGLEKIDFFWYLKKASWGAFAGNCSKKEKYLPKHLFYRILRWHCNLFSNA